MPLPQGRSRGRQRVTGTPPRARVIAVRTPFLRGFPMQVKQRAHEPDQVIGRVSACPHVIGIGGRMLLEQVAECRRSTPLRTQSSNGSNTWRYETRVQGPWLLSACVDQAAQLHFPSSTTPTETRIITGAQKMQLSCDAMARHTYQASRARTGVSSRRNSQVSIVDTDRAIDQVGVVKSHANLARNRCPVAFELRHQSIGAIARHPDSEQSPAPVWGLCWYTSSQ